MIAGSLEIRLFAEMARLQKDMNEAKAIVERSVSGIERAAARAKGALAGMAAGITFGAFANQIKVAVDSLTKLDDMAQKTGSSVQNLSKMMKVAQMTGQEFGTVDSALVKLSKGMATVDSDTNKVNKALGALGVSAKDASGNLRDPSNVLQDISARLQLYRDGANKAALVNDLFGKSGADLLPYLNDVIQYIGKFSGTSGDAAARATELSDTFGLLKVLIGEAFMGMAVDLLPTLQKVADAFAPAADGANNLSMATSALKVILESLLVIGSTVAFTFRGVGTELSGIYEQLKLLAKGDFSGAWSLHEKMVKDAKLAREEHDLYIDSILNGQQKVAKAQKDQAVLEYQSGAEKKEKAAKVIKEQISDYKKLLQEIDALASAERQRASLGRELTQTEKMYSDILADVLNGTKKLKPEEVDSLKIKLDELAALQKINEENKKLADARSSIARISGESQVAEMDHLERLRMEVNLIGKTAEQQEILRAEYEATIRLRRTIGEIAKAGNGVRDPAEEARHIDQLKNESAARIQIIKDEAKAKADAQFDAAYKAIALKPLDDQLVQDAGGQAVFEMYKKNYEIASNLFQSEMENIGKIEARQTQSINTIRELESAADNAQADMQDSTLMAVQGRLLNEERIQSLRAAGADHDIKLANYLTTILGDQRMMEMDGVTQANKRYEIARKQYELALNQVDATDTGLMREEAMVKLGERLLKINEDLYNQSDIQMFGEMEAQKLKDAEFKVLIDQYKETIKQIKAGEDIVAIKEEQLNLEKQISAYVNQTSAGQEAQKRATAEKDAKSKERASIIREENIKKRWVSTINSFEEDVHTSWLRLLDMGMSSWEAALEGFKNSILVRIMDEVYKAFAKPIVLKIVASFAGMLGFPMGEAFAKELASSAAETGSVFSGGEKINWLAAGKSIWTGMSNGFFSFGETISQGFAQAGSFLYESGLSDIGMSLMNSAHSLGVIASYAGAAFAGISIGNMLAGDKSVLGMDGLTTSAIGSAIGALFGPIGALAGGVLGGAVNALFGMGEKKYGATTVQGNFSGAGFAGQMATPWTQKGGVFRSDKSGSVMQALPGDAQKSLDAMTLGAANSFARLISITGEAARSVDGWTFAINRQLSTTEEMKKLFADLSDSMGNHLVPEIASLKKKGESMADTAMRLSDEYVASQAIFDMLKSTIYGTGIASLGLRDSLIQAMGGLQSASGTMESFYQNFYTDAERQANSLAQVNAAFKALGLEAPTTRDQFRSLAETLINDTTPAGQALFAELMKLSPAFANVTKSVQDLAAAALQAMNSIASSLDKMRGTDIGGIFQAQLARDAAMAKVTAAMPWITSFDQLATIQIDDANQYSDANKILIAEALAAGATLAQFAKTAQDAAKALRDKVINEAFANLQRAVQAERDKLTKAYNEQAEAINKSIAKFTELSSALKQTATQLNPMSRGAAQAQIMSALLLAKTGGIFPDAADLADALKVVSEPSEKMFSTFEDYKRDQILTANTINELAKLSDNQLSIEQQTLNQLTETYDAEMERLDAILERAQAQIDAINGVNSSVMTVAAALAAFAAALGVTTPTGTTGGTTGTGGTSTGNAKLDAYASAYNGPITRGTYQGLPVGYTAEDAGGINWVEGYSDAIDPYAEVQRRMALRQAMGVEGFASGGSHSGGWRMVGENGPELEFTPPSQIFSNSDSKKMLGNDGLVAEVRELREIIRAGHIAIERNTSESARYLRRIENDGITINNETDNPVLTQAV